MKIQDAVRGYEEEDGMSKHTPGPWMVKHAGNQDEIWSDRGLVAELSLYPNGSREVAANARLFAAAPDLLEALKTIVDCWSVGGTADDFVEHVRDNGFMDAARAAIAKAERP